MTTYGENIGVMSPVYSTIIFAVAGVFAVFLGLSPKFGAIIHTIPTAILTGASIVFLITIAIWIVSIFHRICTRPSDLFCTALFLNWFFSLVDKK